MWPPYELITRGVHSHILNKEHDMESIKIPTTFDLIRRFHAYSIPSSIGRGIATEITKWNRENGAVWTVKRLKALKTDFLQILSGNLPTSQWIRYRNGVPTGKFGSLFSYGLKNQLNTKTLTRVLNALASYTAYVSSKELPDQLSKFYDSVDTEECDEQLVNDVVLCMKPIARKLCVSKHIKLRTVKDFSPRPSKRAPSSDGRSVPEESWLDTIDCIWETSLGSKLYYNFPQLKQVLNPVSKVVEEHLSSVPTWPKAGREIQAQGFAGKIGHIQEPGLKLRAVANPFRVYQLALSRLGDQIYNLVKTLPWDCTHDQDEGTRWSQKQLTSGHHLYAVDLSNATDMFPLALQVKTLRCIRNVLEEDVKLFEELATSPWLSPTQGLITWKRGQPLGLYPSFGVFTMTHGILLRGLEQSLGISDSFRVLGDDVVISDPKLHEKYRDVLSKLGMPVSADKTLDSKRITEFGGRVITHSSIISIGKWRQSSDRNFLDLLKTIGPRYYKYLQPRQRKVANLVMILPEPVGLGLNPRGLSALDRWAEEEKFLHLYEPKYRLPQYSEKTWPQPLIESKYISHYFRPLKVTPPSESEEETLVDIGLHLRPLMATWIKGGWDSKTILTEAPVTEPMQKPRVKTLRELTLRDEGRPDPLHTVELHTKINYFCGVTTLPSVQFNSNSYWSYPDVLEMSFKLARAFDLIGKMQGGDPRGTSALELWEERIKAD